MEASNPAMAGWRVVLEKAKQGDLDAMFRVGSAYEIGVYEVAGPPIEVELSPEKAVLWFRAGAERGDSSAQLSLGNCLSKGRGSRADVKEALLWYRRSLRNGCSAAATNIAVVYRDLGNLRRSMYWLRRAHDLGDGDATVDLGRAHCTGNGVRHSYAKAAELFTEALRSEYITEYGKCEAMYWLGMACLEGKGRRRSVAQARTWFAKAASCHEAAREQLRRLTG